MGDDYRHGDLNSRDELLSSRAFERLVQSVVDYAIYMIDPRGVVSSWNAGAQRIKQYAADEIIGRDFAEFYTPEDRAAGLPAQALRTARGEGRYAAEGWRVRKDGARFWASVVIDPILADNGELIGFAKITRDISERREAEVRLGEARESLLQAQKMEALGHLIGGFAHDFNNLLTTITAGGELALRNMTQPDKLENILRHLLLAAKRGDELTHRLLGFARRQPPDVVAIDLRAAFEEALGLIRPSLRETIEIEVDVSDKVRSVQADPIQLQVALLNLAFNARDAMATGGVLRLSGANVVLSGEPDGLTGDFVALTVSDTGAGMPPEVLARAFEPFFTTKPKGRGAGLGLSQVNGFARESNGAIRISSMRGMGATITLYLPIAKGEAASASGPRPARRGAHVLVVDDDPIVAEMAHALLTDLGYDPDIAVSGQDALDHLASGGGYDLLFTDIIMPGGISGLALAKQVRERYPKMPILLTTGYSDKLQYLSEFPLLRKPYDYAALDASLAALTPQPDLRDAATPPVERRGLH